MPDKERRDPDSYAKHVSATITRFLAWPLSVLLTSAICLPILWLLLACISISMKGILHLFF